MVVVLLIYYHFNWKSNIVVDIVTIVRTAVKIEVVIEVDNIVISSMIGLLVLYLDILDIDHIDFYKNLLYYYFDTTNFYCSLNLDFYYIFDHIIDFLVFANLMVILHFDFDFYNYNHCNYYNYSYFIIAYIIVYIDFVELKHLFLFIFFFIVIFGDSFADFENKLSYVYFVFLNCYYCIDWENLQLHSFFFVVPSIIIMNLFSSFNLSD